MHRLGRRWEIKQGPAEIGRSQRFGPATDRICVCSTSGDGPACFHADVMRQTAASARKRMAGRARTDSQSANNTNRSAAAARDVKKMEIIKNTLSRSMTAACSRRRRAGLDLNQGCQHAVAANLGQLYFTNSSAATRATVTTPAPMTATRYQNSFPIQPT